MILVASFVLMSSETRPNYALFRHLCMCDGDLIVMQLVGRTKAVTLDVILMH